MKLHNKSGHAFQHSQYDKNFNLVIVEIKAGEVKEIDDEIAKKWLATGQVVEYVAPQEAKAKEADLLKEIERLKAENAKLKGDKDNDQKDAPELETLKKEADELGVQYAKNIGVAALQKKIDDKKAENANK